MREQRDLDLWNEALSPRRGGELFSPRQWCHPPRETQLTLLSWERRRNAKSSPPDSFHIPWHRTGQLHGDTIARQTVDSGLDAMHSGTEEKLGCCQPVFLFYWNIRLSWQKWMLPGITNEPINQWISSAAIKLMRAGWASSSRGYILGKVINAQNRQQSTRLLLSWTILPELFLFWAKYGSLLIRFILCGVKKHYYLFPRGCSASLTCCEAWEVEDFIFFSNNSCQSLRTVSSNK